MSVISTLQPERVWRHFSAICAIAHPSGEEQALRASIIDWANALGIETECDPTGNLLLRKPGAAGFEQARATVLQAHLDMVPQKRATSTHNFSTDALELQVSGGWLKATDTTLGADNGIGVALALALLESDDFTHGPLEVLLTVNEEQGMSGAHGLRSDWLSGRLLLNLDTEEWGQVYLGCAGGMDVNIHHTYQAEPAPADWQGIELKLSGLKGGHSGCDIHRGLGSANVLLVRVLQRLCAQFSLKLMQFQGGTLRNAIARDASAQVAIASTDLLDLKTALNVIEQELSLELNAIEPNWALNLSPCELSACLPEVFQTQLLTALHSCPHGVHRQSVEIPGVVETSNNLARISVGQGVVDIEMMPRSLIDSAALDHAQSICGLFGLIGAQCEIRAPYPGWQPNPDSELLALAMRVFKRGHSAELEQKVIHAGLECGVIGHHYPDMQMISLGPTITGAHSPDEALKIDTVAPIWQFLRQLLTEIVTIEHAR